MSDDARLEFERRLDLLISEYRERVKAGALTGVLAATAKGLVQLDMPRPVWLEDEQVLAVPYQCAQELEKSLNDLLTLRAICIPLEVELPLLSDVTVRIVALDQSVDLAARTVQTTTAGVVFQIKESGVDAQRALVELIAVLRSRPQFKQSINPNAVRIPNITPAKDIPAADEQPPALLRRTQQIVRTPVETEPLPFDEDEDLEWGDAAPAPVRERIPSGVRRTVQLPNRPVQDERIAELETIEARLDARNLFEVLGVHFSALPSEIEEAWKKLQRLTDPAQYESADPDLLQRLERVRERCAKAHSILAVDETRFKHRDSVTDSFQIEALTDMYVRQIETAKLRRDIPDAIQGLRRLLEVNPKNASARHQLAALEALKE